MQGDVPSRKTMASAAAAMRGRATIFCIALLYKGKCSANNPKCYYLIDHGGHNLLSCVLSQPNSCSNCYKLVSIANRYNSIRNASSELYVRKDLCSHIISVAALIPRNCITFNVPLL